MFSDGDYISLRVTGAHAERVIAFERRKGNKRVVAIAPRLFTNVAPLEALPVGTAVWKDTEVEIESLSGGNWKNLLTDEQIEGDEKLLVGDTCNQLPLALLSS